MLAFATSEMSFVYEQVGKPEVKYTGGCQWCGKKGVRAGIIGFSVVSLILLFSFFNNTSEWKASIPTSNNRDSMSVWNYARIRDPSIPRVKVCLTSALHQPQKNSMFIRNYLSRFGGELEFYVEQELLDNLEVYYSTGQLDRSEFSPKVFSYQGRNECPPTWPILHTVPRRLVLGVKDQDFGGVKASTGDEHCRYLVKAEDSSARTAFRQYFTSEFKDETTWLALGPRFEWAPVEPHEIKPLSQREHTFSFQGSITSDSRSKLVEEFTKVRTIKTHPWIKKGVLKFSSKYSKYIVVDRDHQKEKKETKNLIVRPNYVAPQTYRATMLDTVFAFIPSGMSSESFRLYEAIDAGAIPVFALDSSYTHVRCKDSFEPFFRSGAPFITLTEWKKAPRILGKLLHDKAALDKMQRDLFEWRASFYNNQSIAVDCEVMTYFEKYRNDGRVPVDLDRFCAPRPLPPFPIA